MKIENSRLGFDASLGRVDAKKAGDAAATDASKSSSDRIRVSAEAQLANEAVRLASESSDVRPEVVARAKKLFEAGLVGNDPQAIADALITSSLEK